MAERTLEELLKKIAEGQIDLDASLGSFNEQSVPGSISREGQARNKMRAEHSFRMTPDLSIAGVFDVPDDLQDQEANELLQEGSRRNRKMIILNNGMAIPYYDRTSDAEPNYSGKEPGRKADRPFQLVNPGDLDLEEFNMQEVLDPVMTEDNPILELLMQVLGMADAGAATLDTLPTGETIERPPDSRPQIDMAVADTLQSLLGGLTEVPGGPQVGDEQQMAGLPELPGVMELLSGQLGPQMAQPQMPGETLAPEGGMAPGAEIPGLPGMPEMPTEGLPEQPPIPQSEADRLILEQLTSQVMSPHTQEFADYLAFARDRGITPSFGNQGTPGVTQVSGTSGGPGVTPVSLTDNPVAGWEESTRRIGDLQAQRATLQGDIIDKQHEELQKLIGTRNDLKRMAMDPLSRVDVGVLQAEAQRVEDQIEILGKTSQQQVLSGLAELDAEIAREEGRNDALRPGYELGIREQANNPAPEAPIFQAAEAIHETGLAGSDSYTALSTLQKQDVLETKKVWDNNQFVQQIWSSPEQQREKDTQYVKYQEKRGASPIPSAVQDISLLKQNAVDTVLKNQDLQNKLLTINQGADKDTAQARTRSLIDAEVRREVDRGLKDLELTSVQKVPEIQAFLVDPTVPATQQVVEQLSPTNVSTSAEFVQILNDTAESLPNLTAPAEEVVRTMLESFARNWTVRYGELGVQPHTNEWFAAWKSLNDQKTIMRQREEAAAAVIPGTRREGVGL